MKLKLSLLVLGLLAAPLQAATEMTGDIPVELARALLGSSPGQDVKLFSDMPDGFPLPALPGGLSVVAGVDQGYGQRVLLSSASGAEAGREALLQALAADGWDAWQPPQMPAPQTGFIGGPRFEQPPIFCKEGASMLRFDEVSMGQETLFQFNYSPVPPGAIGPCDQPQAGAFGRGMNPSLLQQHMPRLELPADMTRQGRGLQPSGSGGSSQSFENSAVAATDLELAPLFDHFVQQIEAQDWTADARNVGSSVANGFWSKQPQADLNLLATLTIIHAGDGQYQLQIRVQQLGAPVNMPAIDIRRFNP